MSEHLTGLALNRAIAEQFRCSVKVTRKSDSDSGLIYDWSCTLYVDGHMQHTRIISSWIEPIDEMWKRIFEDEVLPDVANDAGEALRLCLELARKGGKEGWYVAVSSTEHLQPISDPLFMAHFFTRERNHTGYEALGKTTAEALANLALDWLKVNAEKENYG